MLFEDPILSVFVTAAGIKYTACFLWDHLHHRVLGNSRKVTSAVPRTGPGTSHQLALRVFPPCVPFTKPVGWALHLDSESVIPQTSSTCRLETQLVSIHQDLGRTSTSQQDLWGLWEYLDLTLLSPWSHPSEISCEEFYFLALLWTFSLFYSANSSSSCRTQCREFFPEDSLPQPLI